MFPRSYVLLVTLVTTVGCPSDPGECLPLRYYASQFDYEVSADEITPSGIAVDRSGQSYPPHELIDKVISDVETCLADKYGKPPVLPPEVMEAYDCRYSTFPLPFPRECLRVKIPSDWFVSKDGTQEVLPYKGLFEGCLNKNPDADPEDGCFCRTGLLCSVVIVSTPSLYVSKDAAIRVITGCNNPWGVRISVDGSSENLAATLEPELRLSECADPASSNLSPRSPLPAKTRPPGFLGYEVDPERTECGY